MTQTLVDRWYAAVRTGDANALADVVCDDVVLLWNGDPARLPWAGTHTGVEAVMAFWRATVDVVRGFRFWDNMASVSAPG